MTDANFLQFLWQYIVTFQVWLLQDMRWLWFIPTYLCMMWSVYLLLHVYRTRIRKQPWRPSLGTTFKRRTKWRPTWKVPKVKLPFLGKSNITYHTVSMEEIEDRLKGVDRDYKRND